ncbi:AAA family ATPase [Thalassobacillus pellis]|uniref:AAA family ATPase n=1 Tax=Thalassobacillus pellis TaxID=748008 RepID=UPI001960700C|nr:AAA family ATPase [Thalassobacillus pellis]MBM7552623.1 SpoVK/Ycf46/Vps4 family AAA+-type ATPase [Thalassobacillus pellis]
MVQKDLEKLQQWKTIDHTPPISEMEALKWMDDLEEENDDLRALLYVILACHRIKRHPGGDELSDYFIKQAKLLDQKLPLISQLNIARQLMKVYYGMEKLNFDQWIFHETDHHGTKMNKTQGLQEMLKNLLDDFDDELVNADLVNASEKRLQLYQDIHVQIRELSDLLVTAYELIENRKTNIPVKEINENLRSLSANRDQLQLRLPDFLTGQSEIGALAKLDSMIGLNEVKGYIHRYYHFLKYQQERKDYGFTMVDEPGLHMIMTGNPGTGKTTLARLLANIYHELGILKTKEVIEVNRSHLVGSYVGQSEENTMNYVKQAKGGVLFIDEAYSLSREGQTGNDYGQAVIDTLVSAMTSREYGDTFAVILAGYPEEMRQFLWSNPGLRSRFPEQNHIELPDYDMNELLQIAENAAMENDYFFTDQALTGLEQAIDKQRVDESFGNARTVRNLVLKTIFQKGAAEDSKEQLHWLDHMRISEEDLRTEAYADSEHPPLNELDELIGLESVKKEVKKLSSFVRIQQKRKQNGLPHVPVQLHSVFTGNPGTGKSTVAKIYAGILKQCGLLKRGHVITSSRSDLVAGFVGQTAIKTKKKIREALGGVLFIDEAYSLYKGGRDDFGKEAVETLVDEMTKHDENLVVILAGYDKEMDKLIDSNPGLASRFKKYIHFPDYDPHALLQMTIYQSGLYEYELEEQAKSFLFEKFQTTNISGNGRFVNNLINEAIQYQALRLENEKQIEMSVLSKGDMKQAWNDIQGEQ